MTTELKKKPAAKKAASTALSVPKAKRVPVEVVRDTGAMDLAAITTSLESERDTVIKHEDAFAHAVLPRYLRMGLQCLKARELFAAEVPNATGRNQHSKEVASPGDATSPPTSFEGWLVKSVPWLKKGSAYKYLRAVQGLGLTHEATPKELDKAIVKARKEAGEKKLSLTLLANRAELIQDQPAGDNTKEDKAGEARAFVHEWVKKWDLGVKAGCLEDLPKADLRKLEDFLRNTTDQVKRRIGSAK